MPASASSYWTIDLRIEPERYEMVKKAASVLGERPHNLLRKAAMSRADAVLAGRVETFTPFRSAGRLWKIHLRFAPEDYERVKRAASLAGEKPHEFIRRAASARAESVLATDTGAAMRDGEKDEKGPTAHPSGASDARASKGAPKDPTTREKWLQVAAAAVPVVAAVAIELLGSLTRPTGSKRARRK